MKRFGSGGKRRGGSSNAKPGSPARNALVRAATGIWRSEVASDKVEYTSKVAGGAMADEGHIRELRAAPSATSSGWRRTLMQVILLELCVTMLQRMMRLRYTLFKTFGNLLFARAVDASTGLPRAADYGTIAWKKETEDSPYLVCSDTTSPKLLANFLRYGPWKIARPNLLITIFGSARDFKLEPPKLARLFSKGFAEAVTTAKAGHHGRHRRRRTRLAADALAQSGSGLPVIGVVPYQKITGWKELLDGKNGEEVSYTTCLTPASPASAPPTTTRRFVLVDSGARTKWGSECTCAPSLRRRTRGCSTSRWRRCACRAAPALCRACTRADTDAPGPPYCT